MSGSESESKNETTTIPEALAHRGLELRETHISWVFLDDDDVWKVKKPVDFGFLDFTTLPKRRAACEAEVRLNRRLAPSTYLGVVPVRRRGATAAIGDDVTGDLVDWAVHMRRLPDADRADERLARNELSDAHIEAIAATLARFHASCETNETTSEFGSVEVVGGNVRENFEQARETLLEYLSEAQAREVEAWQRGFLDAHADTFEARRRAGRVRDGHGDLRLEHVYLDDADGETAVTVVDCIEFNDRFRYADVCADVVFLAMDFARSGRVDLAERFLALYARESGDYDLYPLVDFYESYRAFVRGKIAAMVASNPATDPRTREHSQRDARRYYLLALASERRPLMPPALVAVGGVIAAGKSTVAARLAKELSLPVIDADRTRKALAGIAPTTRAREAAWEGMYSAEFTERTYRELERRARAVLTTGRPVILDASFRSARHRSSLRALAKELGVPFAFVECRAPEAICRERLRTRQGGVSDGRLEIFDDFVASWEPVEELAPSEHVVARTERSVEETLAALRERLPLSFAKLTD